MGKEDFQKVKVWAVVGATADEEKYGYKVFAHLIQKGYTVYPISLKYDFIGERKAYTSLYELPEKPDAVNLIVNPKAPYRTVHGWGFRRFGFSQEQRALRSWSMQNRMGSRPCRAVS